MTPYPARPGPTAARSYRVYFGSASISRPLGGSDVLADGGRPTYTLVVSGQRAHCMSGCAMREGS
eukprot:scaffold2752_cov393-Prasinococcus_capsulatus_cf.AAC.23